MIINKVHIMTNEETNRHITTSYTNNKNHLINRITKCTNSSHTNISTHNTTTIENAAAKEVNNKTVVLIEMVLIHPT